VPPAARSVVLSLGALHERWGRPADALHWHRRALELNPDAAAAWAQAGHMLAQYVHAYYPNWISLDHE